jgi:hypothetical protein
MTLLLRAMEDAFEAALDRLSRVLTRTDNYDERPRDTLASGPDHRP